MLTGMILFSLISVAAAPPPSDALVRIYVGHRTAERTEKRYAGPGIPAGKLIFAASRVFGDEIPETVFIEDGRGRVVGIDQAHGFVVIVPDSPQRGTELAYGETLNGHCVRVAGLAPADSDPPMVERKVLNGMVGNARYSGISISGLDLADVMLVKAFGETRGLAETGAGVFSQKDGRLAGIVIGGMRGREELVVVPARTIIAYLAAFPVETAQNAD